MDFFDNKTIFVIGAKGFLGKSMLSFPPKILIFFFNVLLC